MTETNMATDTKSELKPCPFCGGGAVLRDASALHYGFYISCLSIDCYCALGEGYDQDGESDHMFKTAEAAIEAWNTRHEQHRN